MEETIKKTDEVLAVDEKCAPMLEKALAVTIDDEKGLEAGKNLVKDIRALMKEVEGSYGPLKKSAYATWKAICAEENKQLDPLKRAKAIVEGAIGQFIQKVQEEARIEEERLAKEREAEVDKLTKRYEKHLEGYAEIEQEITDLEEKLQESGLSDTEGEAIHRTLTVLRSKLSAKAETVERNQAQVEEAGSFPAKATQSVSLKGVGGGKMERIPTIFNKEAFIRAVAAGQLPIDLLNIDEGKLKKYINQFPSSRPAGVEIKEKPVVRVR